MHRLQFEFLLEHFWNGLIRHTALSQTVLVIVNSLYARLYTIFMQFRTHLLFLQTSAGPFLYFRASVMPVVLLGERQAFPVFSRRFRQFIIIITIITTLS